MPWRPEGPPQAAFDGQLLGRLPRILEEDVGRQRPPFREGTLSELRVVAVQAERRVRHGQAGAAAAVVEELESPVLVVRATGDGVDVDLVEIVLARILDCDTRLE